MEQLADHPFAQAQHAGVGSGTATIAETIDDNNRQFVAQIEPCQPPTGRAAPRHAAIRSSSTDRPSSSPLAQTVMRRPYVQAARGRRSPRTVPHASSGGGREQVITVSAVSGSTEAVGSSARTEAAGEPERATAARCRWPIETLAHLRSPSGQTQPLQQCRLDAPRYRAARRADRQLDVLRDDRTAPPAGTAAVAQMPAASARQVPS